MGCHVEDRDCGKEEWPRHAVRITKPFWLGTTEVTVGAFRRYTRQNKEQMPKSEALTEISITIAAPPLVAFHNQTATPHADVAVAHFALVAAFVAQLSPLTTGARYRPGLPGRYLHRLRLQFTE